MPSKNEYKKYDYRVFWSQEDRAYIGKVAEFASLAAHGNTPEAALKEIQFVVKAVIEDMAEHRQTPPIPLSLKQYSGKLNVRMPEYLHRELVSEASRQNVSLNQLIVAKLAKNAYEKSQ